MITTILLGALVVGLIMAAAVVWSAVAVEIYAQQGQRELERQEGQEAQHGMV
jgi:hypothetical protein